MSQLLAPIHEFFHVAIAGKQGSDARITGWALSEIISPTARSIMAGWALTFSWGLVAAVIFATIGRFSKAVWFTGGAGLGYAFTTWIRGFGSSDFNSTMKGYVSQLLGPKDQNLLPQIWAEVQHEIVVRWGGIGGAFMLITLIIVAILCFKPKQT
jgi:hypothetical protein